MLFLLKSSLLLVLSIIAEYCDIDQACMVNSSVHPADSALMSANARCKIAQFANNVMPPTRIHSNLNVVVVLMRVRAKLVLNGSVYKDGIYTEGVRRPAPPLQQNGPEVCLGKRFWNMDDKRFPDHFALSVVVEGNTVALRIRALDVDPKHGNDFPRIFFSRNEQAPERVPLDGVTLQEGTDTFSMTHDTYNAVVSFHFDPADEQGAGVVVGGLQSLDPWETDRLCPRKCGGKVRLRMAMKKRHVIWCCSSFESSQCAYIDHHVQQYAKAIWFQYNPNLQ
jgi:hypothetical protein